MAHSREQIRNAAATALSALAGGRVYKSRVYPADVLPAIGVFTTNETARNDGFLTGAVGAKRYNRELDLVVEILAEAIADVDAEVDTLASAVETQLAADYTLGGIAVDCELFGTTVDLEGDGDVPLAVARLTFRVWYRTTAAAPDTPL